MSDDDLAKQVAAALLENVNNRQQPKDIKDRDRLAREKLKRHKEANDASAVRDATRQRHVDVVSPSSGTDRRSAQKTEEKLAVRDSAVVLDEVVPNKFETCIPLLSGGTPLGTPLIVADTLSSDLKGPTPMINQYLSGGARRYVDAGQPQYPPILQQSMMEAGDTEDVHHLMRVVEDEKRRNRRLASAIQVLDREVSLFRNRRQVFITVVGFKLFNKVNAAKSGSQEHDSSSSLSQGGNPMLVGTDEHIEFFIVVDKSVAAKYIVRHRFNHFKALHRMLESGAFKVPRPSLARAPVSFSHDGDGRTTPWQGGGYYNAPPTYENCSSDESESDSDDSTSAMPSNSNENRKSSEKSPMRRPTPNRLLRATEMMPELPNKDRRRPSSGVAGLFSKLSKKLGGKEKENDKEKPCRTAEEAERRAAKQARRIEKQERAQGYKSHVCSVTGIPEEDLPFFERRAKELEIYLRQMLSIELFAESDVMAAFLTPDHRLFTEGKYKDSKEGSGSGTHLSRSDGLLPPGQQSYLMAPPSAGRAGQVSAGGDFVVSGANLAILMGDSISETSSLPIPSNPTHAALQGYCAAPRATPFQTPITTPYVSQGLPSHQQALALAQHQQSHTWSGPLDTPHFPPQAQPRRPTVRTDKKAAIAMLSGKSASPPSALGRPSMDQLYAHDTNVLSSGYCQTSNVAHSTPHQLAVRASPSPVANGARSVTPFAAMFGSDSSQLNTNPNVVAFKTLVIAPDEAHDLCGILGVDAIADYREQRQRDKSGALRTPSLSRSQFGHSPVDGAAHSVVNSGLHPLAPRNASRNGNFLLLLSALGFNSVPVYTTAAGSSVVGAVSGALGIDPSNVLCSGSIYSNSMNSKASIVTPMRTGIPREGFVAGTYQPPSTVFNQRGVSGPLGSSVLSTAIDHIASHSLREGRPSGGAQKNAGADGYGTDDSSGLPSSGLPSDSSLK